MDGFSSILCDEDFKHIDEENKPIEEVQNGPQKKLFSSASCDDYEIVFSLLEKELVMMPRNDYLARLQSGAIDASARNDSVDWIYKVFQHYQFQPSTVCLAINYLDRFLSEYEIPSGSIHRIESWKYQLLSVSCLSVATKMEELEVPFAFDLQVMEENLVFESKYILRMELLLLSTLKWRANAVTPLSFIDYFLGKIINPETRDPKSLISRCVEIILSTSKVAEFIDFRPSEIAVAVAISVAGEEEPIDLIKAIDSCSAFLLNKTRLLRCYEMVEEIKNFIPTSTSLPSSPAGVLDAAALLSYSTVTLDGDDGGCGGGGDGGGGVTGIPSPSPAPPVVEAGDSKNLSAEEEIESVQRKKRKN